MSVSVIPVQKNLSFSKLHLSNSSIRWSFTAESLRHTNSEIARTHILRRNAD